MSFAAKLTALLTLLGALTLIGCGSDSSESRQEGTTSEIPEQAGVVMMQFDRGTRGAELQAVILDVIKYMEEDNIERMLEMYVPAEDLQKLTDSGRFLRVAGRYRMFRDDMLATLKEALTLQPEFNDDSTRASYAVSNAPTELAFVRIGGRWYFPPR